MRQRGRHLAKTGKLARLDKVGLRLAQLLFREPPLCDLQLDLLVDARKIGGAFLHPFLQRVACLLLKPQPLDHPGAALPEDGGGEGGKADEEQDGDQRRAGLRADGRRVEQDVHGPVGLGHVMRQPQILASRAAFGDLHQLLTVVNCLGDGQGAEFGFRIAARGLGARQPRRVERQDARIEPFRAAGHEGDTFGIRDEDLVFTAAPGIFDGIDIDLEDDDPEYLPAFLDRGREIVAALQRRRAECVEPGLLSNDGALEVGTVMEILADERAGDVIVAGGNCVTVRCQDINVRGFQ